MKNQATVSDGEYQNRKHVSKKEYENYPQYQTDKLSKKDAGTELLPYPPLNFSA